MVSRGDLLGGQITMMITDTSTGVPQIKGGKLRALGVSTSNRLPMLPDVPTIDEAGVKGYDMGYWFAAYVPAATPAPVVARLNELLAAGLKTAAAKSILRHQRRRALPHHARTIGQVPSRGNPQVGPRDQEGGHRARVSSLPRR